MAKLVLVTGGCRSGKSDYARRLAESLPPERLVVATAAVTDDEMARRIEAHRQARRDRGWETVEEELDLAGVLTRDQRHAVVLVDCVTLWINNLMYRAAQSGGDVTEDDVARHCGPVLDAAAARRGAVLLVTNEVGWGVVPENPQARRFRDLVGRANQLLAARADRVTLVACGIPLHLKENRSP
jgi:adenosylcobinamide kinase / adenosylcobinamide-phosphate guanylyltransferase